MREDRKLFSGPCIIGMICENPTTNDWLVRWPLCDGLIQWVENNDPPSQPPHPLANREQPTVAAEKDHHRLDAVATPCPCGYRQVSPRPMTGRAATSLLRRHDGTVQSGRVDVRDHGVACRLQRALNRRQILADGGDFPPIRPRQNRREQVPRRPPRRSGNPGPSLAYTSPLLERCPYC